MKYLCLCYYDADAFVKLSQQEIEAIGPQCRPYDEALRATGKVDAVGSLVSPEEWKTIRPVDRTPVVEDGPMSKSSEQAGAFLIIEAVDMDEAVRVASQHPAANVFGNLGFAVEVRQCESFD